MTYSTPHPPGIPDFAVAQQQPGQQLVSEVKTTTTNVAGTGFYCGNVNSIDLWGVCSGACTYAQVVIEWSLMNTFATTLPNAMGYYVRPTSDAIVADCIPVVAPWARVAIFSFDAASFTFTYQIQSALQTQHGVTILPNAGQCISATGNVPHGTTQAIYGGHMSPGLYSWSLNPQTTVTSTTATLTVVSGSIPTTGVLLQVFNPVANTPYNGQVVIGGAQPIWYLNNGNAATLWTPEVYLTGPQL